MNFEITIPGRGADDLAVNLTIEAPNWLAALRKGLAEAGDEAVPPDSQIDIQPHGVIRVRQPSNKRTFEIRPVGATHGSDSDRPQPLAAQATTAPMSSDQARPMMAAPRPPFEPEHPTPVIVASSAKAALRSPPPAVTSSQHAITRPRKPPRPERPTSAPPDTGDPQAQASAKRPERQHKPASTRRPTAPRPDGSARPQGSAATNAPLTSDRTGTSPLSRITAGASHATSQRDDPAATDGPGLTDEQLLTVLKDPLARIETEFVNAEQIIDAAVDLAFNTIAAESALFLLPAGDPRRGRVVAARGRAVKGLLGTVLPLTDDVADVLLNRQSVVMLRDLDWTLRFQGRHQGTMTLDARSLAWAPVLNRGRLVSTLVLINSKRGDGFTTGQQTALEQMCMSLTKALTLHL